MSDPGFYRVATGNLSLETCRSKRAGNINLILHAKTRNFFFELNLIPSNCMERLYTRTRCPSLMRAPCCPDYRVVRVKALSLV
jgi:hypothetical protein